MPDGLDHLGRRRAMAEILSEVLEVATERWGRETAEELIAESVRRSAIREGAAFAAERGATDLASFASVLSRWTAGGALEIDLLGADEARLSFNVTRCKFAEMYRAMGIAELGGLLSCNRDGNFCTGFNSAIRLNRTQTIMEGADHCDFRFSSDEADSG